jgi:hypothetical protein
MCWSRVVTRNIWLATCKEMFYYMHMSILHLERNVEEYFVKMWIGGNVVNRWDYVMTV